MAHIVPSPKSYSRKQRAGILLVGAVIFGWDFFVDFILTGHFDLLDFIKHVALGTVGGFIILWSIGARLQIAWRE